MNSSIDKIRFQYDSSLDASIARRENQSSIEYRKQRRDALGLFAATIVLLGYGVFGGGFGI